MDRQALAGWWNEAWNDGLWAAAWSKAIDGLEAAQAAWRPAENRHSIWQIVNHMIFWREDSLGRSQGQAAPSEAQVQEFNFLDPPAKDDESWQATLKRFRRTQENVAHALNDPSTSVDRLKYLLPHDCYHFGQIMYLRALQDLPPVD